MTTTAPAAGPVRMGEAAGRWVLLATILGSGLALLDSTVVNVALPAIGRDLNAGFAGLQWTVNGYTLTLAALILLGGSLGDRYGRRRIFVVGVTWFAAASLLCGLAVNIEMLVASRALQGVGGALLTPGSLALISASFVRSDRGRAIGAWSGLGGVAAAVGPVLGGFLVQAVSWRLVFLINVPLAVVVVLVAQRHVPESRDPMVTGRLDLLGAATGAAGLAAVTYALIAAGGGGSSVLVAVTLAVGTALLVAFVVVERRRSSPMLPVDIFTSTQFTWANVVTFVVYAALGGLFFLLVVQLQVSLGYSPVAAGAASLPITALMLLLSARAGALAQQIGPRLPMTVGPLLCAGGLLWLARLNPSSSYVGGVLPGVVLFGLGLSATVAPLTATVLAAADDRHSGIASGVNNAVARAASLLAVAVLPLVAGISGDDYEKPAAFTAGFQVAMLVAAGLLISGGVIAGVTIRKPLADGADDAPAGLREQAAVPGRPGPLATTAARTAGRSAAARVLPAVSASSRAPQHHCAINGPPPASHDLETTAGPPTPR